MGSQLCVLQVRARRTQSATHPSHLVCNAGGVWVLIRKIELTGQSAGITKGMCQRQLTHHRRPLNPPPLAASPCFSPNRRIEYAEDMGGGYGR
ncbi:hypothetical protein ACN38_g3440 [Penicillium nordicum]|uniref:Uncharacterized protein n=1 Tax=Penicillium nordicum TaxID=229535 RepID=A0A0N0RZF1_9EURO|nr:hypothetical protein ACN38_g3440 [Penicillium nordicum]